jgi:hypothetical protein
MRTNNAKVKSVIISVYFIIVICIILWVTLFSTFSIFFENSNWTFVIVSVFLVAIFWFTHKVSKYFEYDSDGLKVVLINRGLLLSDVFNYREHKLEIKKKYLKGYKFTNYRVYKNLKIYTTDRYGHQKKKSFNVSLVNRKKRKYIKQSLSKIIKENRKLKSTIND